MGPRSPRRGPPRVDRVPRRARGRRARRLGIPRTLVALRARLLRRPAAVGAHVARPAFVESRGGELVALERGAVLGPRAVVRDEDFEGPSGSPCVTAVPRPERFTVAPGDR